MDGSKRNNLLLWSSVAATAAGIAAVVAIAKWREKDLADSGVNNRLRDIEDVLSDCYRKINEIEEHLPGQTTGLNSSSTAPFKLSEQGNSQSVADN